MGGPLICTFTDYFWEMKIVKDNYGVIKLILRILSIVCFVLCLILVILVHAHYGWETKDEVCHGGLWKHCDGVRCYDYAYGHDAQKGCLKNSVPEGISSLRSGDYGEKKEKNDSVVVDNTQKTTTPAVVEDSQETTTPAIVTTPAVKTTTPAVETTTPEVETTTPEVETTTPEVETTTPA